MRFQHILVSVIACALSACAVRPYQHPTDADSPVLRFTNESKAKVAVVGYDDPVSCKGRLDLTKDKSLNLWVSPDKPQAIKVRVDEPLSFLVSAQVFLSECFMAATLTPRESKEYAARVDIDGNICKLVVGRWDGNKILQDPDFVPRKYRMPFSASQSACADAFVPTRNLDGQAGR